MTVKKIRELLSLLLIFSMISSPVVQAQNNEDEDLNQAVGFLQTLSVEQKTGLGSIIGGGALTVGSVYLLLKAGKFKPELYNVLSTLKIRLEYWLTFEPCAEKSLLWLFYNLLSDDRPSTFFRDAISKNANLTAEELGIYSLQNLRSIDQKMLNTFEHRLETARDVYRVYYNQRFNGQVVYDIGRFHELVQKSFSVILSNSEIQEFSQLENRFDEISRSFTNQIEKSHVYATTDWTIAKQLDQIFSYETPEKLKIMMGNIRTFSQTSRDFGPKLFKFMDQMSNDSRTKQLIFLNEQDRELMIETDIKMEKLATLTRHSKGCLAIAGILFFAAFLAFASDYAGYPVLTEKHYEKMDKNQIREELAENTGEVIAILNLARLYPKLPQLFFK